MTTRTDFALVAEHFVNLALRPCIWDDATEFPPSYVAVLLEIVTTAGFEPKSVVFGKLKGKYKEQDGSNTGEIYPINSLCPYKVVADDGSDDYLATGWLDCACHAVGDAHRKGVDRVDIIDVLRLQIENSVPLQPVQLTAEGDLLVECPKQAPHFSGFKYFVKHNRDEDKLDLGCPVGLHKYCDGYVERRRATRTHDSLVCRQCYMRVLFPKGVETYGQLRGALAIRLAPVAL